jgi:AcrR family transcriptional regulator
VSALVSAAASRLHQRKQQLVRDDISEQAMRLFAQRGFDNATIDAIAEAAGVSRRTFFRYFATKEDVVMARIDKCGQELGEALATRPGAERPLLAIRRAFDPLVAFCMADPAHATTVTRLMRETPALRACHLDKQDRWQAHVTREVAQRLSLHAQKDLWPRVVAAAALAAFDAAFHTWAADTRRDLGALVDEAFAILAGIEQVPAPSRRRKGTKPKAAPRK